MNNQKLILETRFNKHILTMYNNNKIILKSDARIGENGLTNFKQEGDKKTPKGTFKLGKAFGLGENICFNKEYIKLTSNYYWIDDSNSKYYNEMVNILEVKKDWKSAEHLIDFPVQYEYAIEIKYNKNKEKNKGSAIFLHCDSGKDTSGCIAINKESMIKILQIIDEDALIIIK